MNQLLNYIQKHIDFSGEEVGEVLMTRVLENGLFEVGHLEQTICRWKGITVVVHKDGRTILKVFRNGREKLSRAVLDLEMTKIIKDKKSNNPNVVSIASNQAEVAVSSSEQEDVKQVG